MPTKDYSSSIAPELNLKTKQVKATIDLIDAGSTVPFIARYRKEVTGSLTEVSITQIRDRLIALRELDKRRDTVLSTIEKQGKLTEPLKAKILAAETLTVLEDIYLPYKPKRRTRATVAKEKGLEPLAQMIFAQKDDDFLKEAPKYVNAEKKVASVEEALAGARDIIAEWINEDIKVRAVLRPIFYDHGVMTAKVISGKEVEGRNYKDYFDWQERAKSTPSHRMLAVRRAEKEKIVAVKIRPPEDKAVSALLPLCCKGKGQAMQQVREAAQDSYKRLLSPSLESELKAALKRDADVAAIEIFQENLRQLMMSAPLGRKRVLAVDPGIRTGSKIVALDEQGELLHNDTMYTMSGAKQKEQAKDIILRCCKDYQPSVIAIGNGTASRETEAFIRALDLPKGIDVVLVSETGASVYSASEVARKEFPDYDVTVRGSVSIGRRLMDPLAELVKIEPKAIGVGQYQHDVDQKALKNGLDDVVISCVNHVGVEVNSASKELLAYVSGLGPARAQAIIDYRHEHGPFTSREQIRTAPGLGDKAFEQAAGFLRIRGGSNPLDESAVHPESYVIVAQMAKDAGCGVEDLIHKESLHEKIDVRAYVSDSIGLPTLQDIKDELAKPGRDPRAAFQPFAFKEGVNTLNDLEPEMILPGIVTNITAFGAFVDVGIHHDALVHISELSDRFVKNPGDVVKVHQQVQVKVLEVDRDRKRVKLSMKNM